MTLDETVLQKLADWEPAQGARQTLAVPDAGSGWSVELTVDRHDALSSAIWELRLRRVAPVAAPFTLADWAEGIASRVTGLLEPLRVHEIDTQRGEALLRSTEPTQRKADRFYYEVLLQGTRSAQVRRYQATPEGGRRDQVAFVLTHETLAKFIKDLAGA